MTGKQTRIPADEPATDDAATDQPATDEAAPDEAATDDASADETATDAAAPDEAARVDTFDWDDFWRTADEADREGATPSTHNVRELLDALFEERGVPSSFASVGCGPGVVAFDVADRYPDTSVVGYDAAATILDENRERAATDGIANIAFERTVLPDFDSERKFECVLCYGTLSYVEQSATALQALYDAVEPGGHLVLGYANAGFASHMRRVLENPASHGKDPDAFDADDFRRRWRLVLEERSTLSYADIHDAVGTWPRSFWEFAEKPTQRWAWQDVPLVWLPK